MTDAFSEDVEAMGLTTCMISYLGHNLIKAKDGLGTLSLDRNVLKPLILKIRNFHGEQLVLSIAIG